MISKSQPEVRVIKYPEYEMNTRPIKQKINLAKAEDVMMPSVEFWCDFQQTEYSLLKDQSVRNLSATLLR